MSPTSGAVLLLAFLPLLSIAATYTLSIYLGRYKGDIGTTVPWISDTFELDPESGIAHVILGPCSCGWVFVLYIWNRRIVAAAGRNPLSCKETRKKLACSYSVVLLTILACLFMHGLLGFKIFSSHTSGMAHLVCAAAFAITAWLITLLATVYEFRADLASLALTLLRLLFSLVMLAGLVLIALSFFLFDACPTSQLSSFSGLASSSLQVRGVVCVEAPVLADACLELLMHPSPICAMAPASEIAVILALLCWFMTLSFSFSTARVEMKVVDARFRKEDTYIDEDEDELDEFVTNKNRQSGASDVSVLAPLGLHRAREGDGLKDYGASNGKGSWRDTGKGTGKRELKDRSQTLKLTLSAAFNRLVKLHASDEISTDILNTVQGVLICLEADEEVPNEGVLADRLRKLFHSLIGDQRRGNRRPITDTMSRRRGERTKGLAKGALEVGPTTSTAERREGQEEGHDEGQDPLEPHGFGGETVLPTALASAPSLGGKALRGTDKWKQTEVAPDLANLSEFDPVSPAITAEQRRRARVARQAAAARKPRTPHEAWEAHMKAMGMAGEAHSLNTFNSHEPSGPNHLTLPPAIPGVDSRSIPAVDVLDPNAIKPQLAIKLKQPKG